MRNHSTQTSAKPRVPRRTRSKSQHSQARRLHSTVGDVRRDVQELGQAAKGAAQEQLHHVKEKAADYMEQSRDKLMGLEVSMESHLREQPLKSMLIACGVGFALGLFLRR